MDLFQLLPLPYAYDALEPYISEETLRIHHDKLLKAYVDNLNQILMAYPMYQHWTLEELICHNNFLPENIRIPVLRNAGGIYNHNFYFYGMTPDGINHPIRTLKDAIDRDFGSFDSFRKQFEQMAKSLFGSGYTWLTVQPDGKLLIVNTSNQDTVLPQLLTPILNIDVWEHAYFLQYKNKRINYIENWVLLIDWIQAESYYQYFLLNQQNG